jgi:hypothetical protein
MKEQQLKSIIGQALDEQRRHYEAFVEHTLTDQLGAVHDKIDAMSRDIDVLKTDMAIVKSDVGGLKTHVAQLDGRVGRIEDHLGLNGHPKPSPKRSTKPRK